MPMATTPQPDAYAAIAPFDDFAAVADPSRYHRLPDDWLVAVADVVDSTAAVRAGRYKAVNMAGAAVLSAVTNRLGGRTVPFVFGGDGAMLAVAPGDAAVVRRAMAETASWAAEQLDLRLRVAMIPVHAIRQAGHDLLVARYAASPLVSYAMFDGSGVDWAEREAKAGRFAVAAAEPGSMPDLTGLSCQWGAVPSTKGVILSIIVRPTAYASPAAFTAAVREVLGHLDRERGVNPVPREGPAVTWPGPAVDLQARSRAPLPGGLPGRRLAALAHVLFAWIVLRSGLRVGGFDPERYRREVAMNTDFRKYANGLMMTVDCTPATAAAIEAALVAARERGAADFGLHRQASAMITCVAPSVLRGDHLHFLDGSDGGYTMAAQQLGRR